MSDFEIISRELSDIIVVRERILLSIPADQSKLNKEWISALGEKISLEAMILDYPRHFRLHLDEITELMEKV